jgi:hypothetical protein
MTNVIPDSDFSHSVREVDTVVYIRDLILVLGYIVDLNAAHSVYSIVISCKVEQRMRVVC